MNTGSKKFQFGIRLSPELNRRLENPASKIGISKNAFILNLIFNELEKSEKKLV